MSNNVIIFGDSYSTYKGHIPEDYEPYYYPGGYSNGVEKNDFAPLSISEDGAYGLSYEGFIALLIAKVQKLAAEVKELKNNG